MAERNVGGRPTKEFDKKSFIDLIELGCSQEEICWYFRDETGKPAAVATLSRWCKREFGTTFEDYRKQNALLGIKTRVRQNQLKLSERSAAMAIFLGKNYLGQSDCPNIEDGEAIQRLEQILATMKKRAGETEDLKA